MAQPLWRAVPLVGAVIPASEARVSKTTPGGAALGVFCEGSGARAACADFFIRPKAATHCPCSPRLHLHEEP
jgi:hypothetical protein